MAVNKAGLEQLPDEPDERAHFGLSCVLGPTGELLAGAGGEPYEVFAVDVDLDAGARGSCSTGVATGGRSCTGR